ncbi:retrovirus-related pol polyprotein from transposon TNT 1-94 [Tanacetum coccineum]
MVISERKYALELLKYVGVLEEKPTIIPLDLIKQLIDKEGDLLPDPSLYRTIVGKLIYLTITRPDLSFAAQLLSQFSKQPRTPHMKALLKVLRYIKLCPGQGLHFPTQNSLQLKAFVIVIGLLALSSTKTEYRALADCTCELTWLLCLFKDLKVNIPTPMNILCDNESAIAFFQPSSICKNKAHRTGLPLCERKDQKQPYSPFLLL